MKRLLTTAFIFCSIFTQYVITDDDKTTLCFEIPETLEKNYDDPQEILRTVKGENESGLGDSIPLYKCFTNWKALIKSPAPIFAASLALLKLTMGGLELYKGIKTDWENSTQLDTAILFVESIVFGYLANWFVKDFIRTCREQPVHLNKSRTPATKSDPNS